MSVRELLRRKPEGVATVESRASIAVAARRLIEHGVGGLAVVDVDGTLVGFMSERDIVRAVDRGRYFRELPVTYIMTRPAPTCAATAVIHHVMARMTRERVRHLVVLDTDEGRLCGVISVGDLVRHRLEHLETETGVLRDYIAGQRAGG